MKKEIFPKWETSKDGNYTIITTYIRKKGADGKWYLGKTWIAHLSEVEGIKNVVKSAYRFLMIGAPRLGTTDVDGNEIFELDENQTDEIEILCKPVSTKS